MREELIAASLRLRHALRERAQRLARRQPLRLDRWELAAQRNLLNLLGVMTEAEVAESWERWLDVVTGAADPPPG
jgi:hypothetical protein